ncbi:MAG TPA: amidohydrolase [Sedimentibacter sp.]|nr:amidohydrolase [Sedimentibacter sp.]
MKILIKNIKIITMDDERPFIDCGNIVIENDRITEVTEAVHTSNNSEKQSDVKFRQSDGQFDQSCGLFDRIIDGNNKLALPGFINAHTHVGMVPFRNYANDLPLDKWLFEKLFPMEDKLTADDIFWASQMGIAEMVRTGTTCFADMYMFEDTLAQVAVSTGIRADLARGLQCFDDDFDIKTDRRVLEAVDLFNRYHNAANGRIKVRFGPHAVYTCTPRYLADTAELAGEMGIGIHIHLSETANENKNCISAYGKSPARHLADLGVFNLPTIAAHGVHLSDEDMSILKQHKVSIIHNPASNLKLGSGVMRVAKAVEKGINVGIGTDGPSSNNALDMMREIYLAAVLSKGVFEDSVGIKAYEALKMATVNGAKALGLDDVGKLKQGMKADITLIDLDQPHYYPLNDPVSAIVYCGKGSDVHTVIVDGNILYENGEYKTTDMEAVKANVMRIAEEVLGSEP